MSAILAIVKRLFLSNKISFIITFAVVLLAQSSGNVVLSNGNYLWLLAVLSPFFFVFYDFMKLIHIGASKRDYYVACLIAYASIALFISILNAAVHVVIDPLYNAESVINMMDVCRWTENGIIVATLQQMFFLLLFMVFLHVLLSMQAYWYGWLTDIIIVAIISIFTPFTALRAILSSFFCLVMINGNAILHIAVCLVLIFTISALGIMVLKRKKL